MLRLGAKNFDELKSELIRYTQEAYPEIATAILDNSIGSLLLDLNAGIGDSLHFYIDRNFNEVFVDTATQRSSLYQLAINNSVKLPNKTPSVTVCDFTVTVPVSGDTYDSTYLPIIKVGTQVNGSGQTFEIEDDINFNFKTSTSGIPNIKYLPRFDSNNRIIAYDVTKREVIFNGISKQYKFVVGQSTDFFTLILPDTNVISVEQIVIINSTNTPDTLNISDYFNTDNRWYEVNSLSDSKVFVENGQNSDGTKRGEWIEVDKKYVVEFTTNGFCKIRFGNGQSIKNNIKQVLKDDNYTYNLIEGIVKNNSLGLRVPANSTIFVRYRVGGGVSSNVPPNTLTSLGFRNIEVNGFRADINQTVINSLKVNNPIPAIGGKDALTNEELRNLIKFNLKSQNRCIEESDYTLKVMTMDSKYGKPFKVNTYKSDNKVIIGVLGITPNGKLTNQTTDFIKRNIENYLKQFKAINDYVEVKDNNVINIGVDIEIVVDNNIDRRIVNQQVLQTIKNVFDITKRQLGDDIYVGEILKSVYQITGVLNITKFVIYNIVDKTGTEYSPNQTTMEYVDNNIPTTNIYSKEIKLIENTLFASDDEMFEIRYPEKDVKIFIKQRL